MLASEAIQKTTRVNSIQRGKDRTVVKSTANARALGSFFIGFFNYYLTHPLSPTYDLPQNITNIRAFEKEAYLGQVNCHLEIDPILMTLDFDPIVVLPLGGGSEQISRKILNANLTTTFKTNSNLPPNTNVYFVITGKKPPVYAEPFTELTYSKPDKIGGRTGNSIGYGIYSFSDDQIAFAPNPYGLHAGFTAVYRTDATGRIQSMDTAILGNKFEPFLFQTNAVGFRPSFWDTVKLEVREIKERYNNGDLNFPFYTRSYQELTDNEWDTKVATDA